MVDLKDEATAELRALVGSDDAEFHPGQYEAVEALVAEHRRALVVQRTGWGKSAVYFVATLLLRSRGAGPTLIVSPLLALMRDQIAAAERAGVTAVAINSANAQQWPEIIERLDADAVDVLLISPERLNNPRFRDEQLPQLVERTGLLVVDEAHCISDWGHDFRPDYRRLRDLIVRLDRSVPVLATTATANARVVVDVEEQLDAGASSLQDSDGVLTLRGPLARSSLRLGVLDLPDSRDRLAWLLTHLEDLPGSGIIYALTVSAAEDTAAMLADAGHAVRAYTGRTDPAERADAEAALKTNDVKALVATSALGMGFDKPDLRFIVHLGAPSSPVAYYQQVGRAGRATDNADVLLLPGAEDEDIWTYFAFNSMPEEDKANAVLTALGRHGGVLSTAAIETRVDVKRSQLELLLKVLDVEGAVQRVSGGWQRTAQEWTYDVDRYKRIADARLAEQRSMLTYETTSGCRMEYLAGELDDPNCAPCGRCDNCAGRWFSPDIDRSAEENASTALNRVGVAIEPRAQWPTGMSGLDVPVKGKIDPAERVERGRALARLTDLGWGGPLREVFKPDRPDGPIGENMLRAVVRVLADWDWRQRPGGIVAMPSRSRPDLIGSTARGLAEVGKLPFLGPLEYADDGPVGDAGGNSAYRLAAVWERFVVSAALQEAVDGLAGAPLLLVDDLVDSRWTVTVAGRTLLAAGSGPVLPLALAMRG